jgi:hypothetical protein
VFSAELRTPKSCNVTVAHSSPTARFSTRALVHDRRFSLSSRNPSRPGSNATTAPVAADEIRGEHREVPVLRAHVEEDRPRAQRVEDDSRHVGLDEPELHSWSPTISGRRPAACGR